MALLNSDHLIFIYFAVSLIFFSIFSAWLNQQSVWERLGLDRVVRYKKAGEYGEAYQARANRAGEDAAQRAIRSPWIEPNNAWTSLAYSILGGIILLYSVQDSVYTDNSNVLSKHPLFSLMYGLSCVVLGVTSCLFHASHSEFFRKADAGMTSGVMAAPLVLALYDRLRPPAMDNSAVIVMLGIIFQLSLTIGYLPYGSSDVVLPLMVVSCFALELLPRYGGPVDSDQYFLWYQCILGAVNGMLFRAADLAHVKYLKAEHQDSGIVPANIHDNSDTYRTGTFNFILRLHSLILFMFGYFLIGFGSYTFWSLLIAGLMVTRFPHLGHVCWHFGSAFSLFIWWYMYRTRPGDPTFRTIHQVHDAFLVAILFGVLLKNGVRRIFMACIIKSAKLTERVFILLEHVLFSLWALWVLAGDQEGREGRHFFDLSLCWSLPQIPSEPFHLFYIFKVATHVEDVLFLVWTLVFPTTSGGPDDESRSGRDVKMILHHLSTAVLCICSYFSGYAKIGSVIMLLHDASDVPLDVVRIAGMLPSGALVGAAKIAAYIATLASWAYWRLYYFPFHVLYSVAVDSKSMLSSQKDNTCDIGSCTYKDVPERVPFLLLLGSLQLLHVIWFFELLRKGANELLGVGKVKGLR